MITRFLRATLLLWLGHALLGLPQALASHAQAGQLSYLSLGNNQYRIRLQFFRDCSGVTPANTTVVCKSGGCGTGGQTVNGTLVQVGQPIVGQPYCTSIQAQAPCTLTGPTPGNPLANYAVYTYETTTPVTLPPAAEWIISWEEGSRPSVRNLLSEGNLRLEARLNNLATPAITPRNPTGAGPTITLQNNSPQFSSTNLPVPFVPVNQQATISFAAVDAERDSLVYSLDGALNGCGTYETYEPYPSNNCQPVVLSTNPPCILQCPPSGPSNTYSAQLPLPVAFDTVGTCPNKTVQYRFSFNAQQASFTFTANRFIANATSASGDNKYVVVGKVTEYRKINGIYYKVGTARRDFLVIIINAANFIPAPPTGQAGPPRSNATLNITRDTTDVTIYSCNYTRLRLNFTDPDNTPANPNSQNLTVFYPADLGTNILQAGDIGTFMIDRQGRPTPAITFYFQPTRATNGTTLLIPLRIEDDGCPIKGVQYRALRVRIANDPQAAQALIVASSGSAVSPTAAICTGGRLTLMGSVNRPDSVRNTATGLVRFQIYRYQWAAMSGSIVTTTPTSQNGLPTVTNVSNIVVQPTVTTRYRLSIDPTIGFGQNVCGDTTSVLVRVVPQPAQPSITRTGNLLTSSAATGNQWYFNGQPIAGATGVSYLATTPGSYTVVSSVGMPPLVCSSLVSAAVLGSRAALPGTSVSIAPNPTADGRVLVTLTGYRQAVMLNVLDALGRVVSSTAVAAPNPAGTAQALDLAALPTGVYVLRVLTAGGVDVRRLVRE